MRLLRIWLILLRLDIRSEFFCLSTVKLSTLAAFPFDYNEILIGGVLSLNLVINFKSWSRNGTVQWNLNKSICLWLITCSFIYLLRLLLKWCLFVSEGERWGQCSAGTLSMMLVKVISRGFSEDTARSTGLIWKLVSNLSSFLLFLVNSMKQTSMSKPNSDSIIHKLESVPSLEYTVLTLLSKRLALLMHPPNIRIPICPSVIITYAPKQRPAWSSKEKNITSHFRGEKKNGILNIFFDAGVFFLSISGCPLMTCPPSHPR